VEVSYVKDVPRDEYTGAFQPGKISTRIYRIESSCQVLHDRHGANAMALLQRRRTFTLHASRRDFLKSHHSADYRLGALHRPKVRYVYTIGPALSYAPDVPTVSIAIACGPDLRAITRRPASHL